MSTTSSCPTGARVTGAELAAGKRAWLHEEVAGVRLRVSARSFFQAGPEAAEALVATVATAAGEMAEGARLADLYGGVGLFAATVGRGRTSSWWRRRRRRRPTPG